MPDDLFSINILGIRIDEPVTVLTDIIITTVCIYAFLRLSKSPGKNQLRQFLKIFFLFLGVGTFLGGLLGHGFLYMLSSAWRLPGWMIPMIAIALLEHSSVILIREHVSPLTGRILLWQNIILLPVFMVLLLVTQDFMFVVIYITFGTLVMVGSMQGVIYRETASKGSLWFLIAVVTGLAGDIVFVFDWSLHEWFNNNDLSHILLAFSAWFFYLGAKLFLSAEDGSTTMPIFESNKHKL
jgi:hypothetical protein